MNKRRMVLRAMGIGISVIGLSGCAAQSNVNGPATNSNMAAAAPTPDKAAIEAELTRIENDWPRIIKEHDGAAVQRVEADDIILVYPDGSLGSKQRDVEDIGSGALTADSWNVLELHVNVLDNDSAVVGLRTNVVNGKYKMPNGKSQNVSGQFRFVDTFARRNGQWQLVGSVGVPIISPSSTATASPAESPATKPSPAAKALPAESPMMKPSPKASPTTRPSPRRAATPTATP